MATSSHLPSSVDFERMETELFQRITVRHRRQILRHRLVAAAAIVFLAGAGVAAGTVANPSQQRNLAYCYSSDSLSSRSAQNVLSNNFDPKSKPNARPSAAKIARAVALCDTVWEAGVFGSSVTKAPRLQACLRDNLIVSVFPKKKSDPESADDFCGKLGLSAP
jgi:hypothetical protein